MVFAVAERDRVTERLLALAQDDPDVMGAAVTGSQAVGGADRWSDIDLMFGIRGDISGALERWAGWLHGDFAAVHHWDLPSGPTVYRVFLLPGWLEVDLGFTPAAAFGPLGPNWRTVFGQPVTLEPAQEPGCDDLAGRAWHHALHARLCIDRDRRWQAEYWIGALRGQVIALACLRLGLPTAHAKGAHLLPVAVLATLEPALVRAVEQTELRRALNAAVSALAAELDQSDRALAVRLRPLLHDLQHETTPTPDHW